MLIVPTLALRSVSRGCGVVREALRLNTAFRTRVGGETLLFLSFALVRLRTNRRAAGTIGTQHFTPSLNPVKIGRTVIDKG